VVIQTLWDRFWQWVVDRLHGLTLSLHHIPALQTAVTVILATLAVVLIARLAYVALSRDTAVWGTRHGRGGMAALTDPWSEAQRLATLGDFTGAAHALYAALLGAIARREPVRLHDSKTVGDYARELRGLASPRFGGFREFARAYETVVYGLGSCDRARYDRLLALATPLVQAPA
jgi:hypothetical protein